MPNIFVFQMKFTTQKRANRQIFSLSVLAVVPFSFGWSVCLSVCFHCNTRHKNPSQTNGLHASRERTWRMRWKVCEGESMSMSDSRQNEREHIYTRHCIAVDTLQFNAWLMYAVQMDVYTDTICMYIFGAMCTRNLCVCECERA